MKTNILICAGMIGLFWAIGEPVAAVIFFVVAVGMVLGMSFKKR